MEGRGVSQAAVCELPECVLWETWENWGGREQASVAGRDPTGATFQEEASDLPYPLGQLWDSLAWVDMSWLLCRAWQTVGMLGLAHIALSIWRNVQKKQRWASNQNQSHRKGRVCGVQVRPGPIISRDEDRLLGKVHLPMFLTVQDEGQNHADAWGHLAFASPLPERVPASALPEEGSRKSLEVPSRRDVA